MIDIYARLGASGPSDRRAIDRSLEDQGLPPDVRRIAAFVIGDPDRRAVHDATWATVVVVARLRALLQLELSPMWISSGIEEFARAAQDARRTSECLPIRPAARSDGP